MTRWARPSQGKWKRPEEATSWAEFKATLNIPLKKKKSDPTVSQKASTKINQIDKLTNESRSRLPEVSVTQNIKLKKLLSATEQKEKSAKKNIQNQFTINGVGNPKIKFNKSIAKESLMNQEKEKFTAVKKQINNKSDQSLNIKNKKLLRKKGKIKMTVYDYFIATVIGADEPSNSRKIEEAEENSTVEDKREVNKLGLLSKTRNRLKNVRKIKTKLSKDNTEEENNLQNEKDTEINGTEDANDTDENEIEQNINNNLDQNISNNGITKDEQIRSHVDKVKNRVSSNKLLKKKLSKNRMKFQKSSSELKNETLTQHKAKTNFTTERIQVFHNNRYKWVKKNIVEGVQVVNRNLSKEDINEFLYKAARKNSRKGRLYCWLCEASNHTIDNCPFTKKITAVGKHQHSDEDISKRCTNQQKVIISGGCCLECWSFTHHRRKCPELKKYQDEVLCAQNDRESVRENYPASDETNVKDQPRQVTNIIRSERQSPYKSKPQLKQQVKVEVSKVFPHQCKIGGTVFF